MFNKKQFVMAAFGLSLFGSVISNIANAGISQTPLFVGEAPHPNIMFTLDNSGSMNWEFLPDAIGCFDSERFINAVYYSNVGECNNGNSENPLVRKFREIEVMRYRSNAVNKIYYDPKILYLPWKKSEGDATYYTAPGVKNPVAATAYFPPSDPAAALRDPRAPATPANTVNLIAPNDPNDKYCPLTYARDTNAGCSEAEKVVTQKFIAFYFDYRPAYNTYRQAANEYDTAQFVRNQLDSSWVARENHSADRIDCAQAKCTYLEEQQNYANWFTYYRKRIFTAIAGVSQAFYPLDGKQRVGYAKINVNHAGRNVVDDVSNRTVLKGVREFVGTDRAAFYDQLFENVVPSGGTPLREAMDQVGKYFSRDDEKGPWAERPGVSRGVESACRRSFNILMTDGMWNGSESSTAAKTAEKTTGPNILNHRDGSTYTYNPSAVGTYYNSGQENTLANVAMYYWNRDLRPDINNYVPVSTQNPAYWQHLVQYTVGFGVDGERSYPADAAALKNGTLQWPATVADQKTTVDDLWHAAVNSRGLYFSAKNPKAFRDSLIGALQDIASQPAASASVALNFEQTGASNTSVFVPTFIPGPWTGSLVAREVNAAGQLTANIRWAAEDLLPAPASRNIVTFKPDAPAAGINFAFATLTSTQKAAVGSADVVDYLRGSAAKEVANGGTFRSRIKKLGDIVNSAPEYVHKLNHGYGSLNGYSSFVATKTARNPMVYVGANDGMLHAFDAATGVETFAYIPNSVFPFLKSLSQTNYTHHYFVDGPLNEGDAYGSDGKWHTLLAGSTGAGARSVFMLDVTNPGTVSTPGLSASSVLWERSGEAGFDSDLGHVLSKIEVVRLRNGKWAAIFGNGYGSASKKAVLYVVDPFTGNAIPGIPEKIILNSGNTADNGLSQPALLFNTERQLLAVYAGDLQGNLWKVDFGADGKGTVGFSGAPLFTTKDDASPSNAQPIIQRPALGGHPKGGLQVMFGTGKYFDVGDQANVKKQTVYGIWDKPGGEVIQNSTGRNVALQEQTLTPQTGGASLTSIPIDWATKRGWFVDLSLSTGSRAVGNPYIVDDTTLFVTALTPVPNTCDSGGRAAFYSFNILTGGATNAFDPSNEAARLSVVEIGSTMANPATITIKPLEESKCTGPGCCKGLDCCVGTACEPKCPSRTIVVNQLDGSQSQRPVSGVCRAPLRTWHLLNN